MIDATKAAPNMTAPKAVARSVTTSMPRASWTVTEDGFTWSAAVDVLGFKHDDSVRLKQVDWAAAIEDAGRFIKKMVADKVELAGGGTLNPPILPPET
ncbi:hypothetical protein [Sorangium sp. So ce131]|uniref:hypothetical protein n=1 Tax=Sorangium sp. So ce131 TaxID=3133282 RepID=UPI003F5E9AC5